MQYLFVFNIELVLLLSIVKYIQEICDHHLYCYMYRMVQ